MDHNKKRDCGTKKTVTLKDIGLKILTLICASEASYYLQINLHRRRTYIVRNLLMVSMNRTNDYGKKKKEQSSFGHLTIVLGQT